MQTTCQLFYSLTGEMLPRWREAFPEAKTVSQQPEKWESIQPAIAWIRVVDGISVGEQLAALRARIGSVPIVVLSDIPNDEEALAAFAAAARAYCNSHATPEVLQQIANVVSQGGLWIGETLMQRLLKATGGISFPLRTQTRPWQQLLTDRERAVAESVSSGASNKEIARELGITERTVKAHVSTILDKLQIRDRLQLALVVHNK